MNEENTQVKITMPLIDDIELKSIDTFYNDIVSEYTKAFVKEKDQVIAQRLMMNLQQENARLKDKIDMAIKYYESNQQECVIGRNKDDKLIKEYYLPAQCSKKMLDILKEN